MAVRLQLLLVLMLTGCARELALPAVLDFGDTWRGATEVRTFTLMNPGARRSFVFVASPNDFTVQPSEVTLDPNQRVEVTVSFAPRRLGPQSGWLSLGDAGPSVLLRGGATGPLLQTPAALVLPTAALVDGATEVVSGTLVLRNMGTTGSSLTLSKLAVTGPGLCVGVVRDGACEPATLPVVKTGVPLSLPVTLQVSDATSHPWGIAFDTDDFEHPHVDLSVRVAVEQVSPCQWLGPSTHRLADPRALTFTHAGTAPCLLRELAIVGAARDAIEVRGPSLPRRVGAGESFSVSLVERGFAIAPKLELRAAGTAPFVVTLDATSCLSMQPAALDFGTLTASCTAAPRIVQLINTCAREIAVSSAEVRAPFVLTSDASLVTIAPAGSLSLFVRFAPTEAGAFSEPLTLVTDSGTVVVAVQGRAEASPQRRDVFRDDPPSVGDVLVLVDSSPSFVPKRPEVRANLEALLLMHENQCLDQRWALAPADRASGVQLSRTDAGTTWVSTLQPQFVARLLSAFDSLPIGSEDEACVEPAVNLLTDAGVRPQGVMSALCITDAPEAPGAFARFADFEGLRPPGFTRWNVVGPLARSTCAVEASDDGVHAALVNRSGGGLADICDANWATMFGPVTHQGACGRSRYYLTSVPSGPITVLIDGTTVPSAGWWFDPATNSVGLQPWVAPPPGGTVEVVYQSAC